MIRGMRQFLVYIISKRVHFVNEVQIMNHTLGVCFSGQPPNFLHCQFLTLW